MSKLIRWFIEPSALNKDGTFKIPPRIIKIYDDETCKFFTSKKAKDYVVEIDRMFKDGYGGDLTGQRAYFKAVAKRQKGISEEIKRAKKLAEKV